MEWKDIIALVLGTIGTTLGVINLIRSFWDDRVRLRVIPSLARILPDGLISASSAAALQTLLKARELPTVSIEVINLSKFPVTVSEIGLCEGHLKKRAPFIKAQIVKGEDLPRRLEPREAVPCLAWHVMNGRFVLDSVARGNHRHIGP